MTHANRRSLRVFTALTALLLTAAVILSLNLSVLFGELCRKSNLSDL